MERVADPLAITARRNGARSETIAFLLMLAVIVGSVAWSAFAVAQVISRPIKAQLPSNLEERCRGTIRGFSILMPRSRNFSAPSAMRGWRSGRGWR